MLLALGLAVLSISAKTVVISEGAGRDGTRRLTVARFDSRNRNWHKREAWKQNSEWTD